ncbi:MAG: coproporphyrinogen dehydrogenase HemZ [Oscillospiraceae bacterium]|nr:coproporphyrinogen dehydrogenase HemZ [Oscillospiraceae bacterium]
MKIYIQGEANGYDTEHLVRIFYPDAVLEKGFPHKGDCVTAWAVGGRLACAVRENGRTAAAFARWDKKEKQGFSLAALCYQLLKAFTGRHPAWGLLTGVRPVRLFHDFRAAGKTEEEIERRFFDVFDVTPEKFSLAKATAAVQRPALEHVGERDYSLYVSIPFCPTRCSYCSFVSRTVEKSKDLIGPYVGGLCRELEEIAARAEKNRLRLKTIYIGGGTPTALTAQQLRLLMETIRRCFPTGQAEEYTVEAGRPDCTDAEKLSVLKEYGATRISINPQTFSDEVLRAIGRRHTAEDVTGCFYEARRAGHDNINMDLIAGLPKDTPAGFEASLDTALQLAPENITVHTLTLKRASNLVVEHRAEEYGDVEAMLRACGRLPAAGYLPYYLYRQKGTLRSLENTGYAKPGRMGLYNIYMMEEVHTILAAGAGAVTKLKAEKKGLIQRIFNYKYPAEYLKGFDEILRRKEGVDAFYACHVYP